MKMFFGIEEFILIFFLIININFVNGQSLNIKDVIPNSPNASELGRFGTVPVGLFTGTIQQNIPIYEFKTKSLSVPITLNYSSNGLMVDKIASWVGFDWSLDAGGVINRSVRGRYDEPSRRVPLPSNFEDPTFMETFFTSYYLIADFEPDIYSYNFVGGSGKFIINNGGQTAVTIPYNKISITTTRTGGNMLYDQDFLITTPDGIKYLFASNEIHYSYYDNNETYNYPNSWYLTSIVHPNGDTIKFFYSTISLSNSYSGVSQKVAKCIEEINRDGSNVNCFDPTDYQPVGNIASTGIIFLDSIWSRNYGSVVFQRSANRLDYTDGEKLDKILIKDKNQNIIKSFRFNYQFVHANPSYPYSPSIQWKAFLGSSYTSELSYRMFLDSIVFSNSTDSKVQKYSFEYLKLDSIPSRLSFSQDHWGYFNGTINSDFIPSISEYVPSQYQNRFTGFIGANRNPNGHYSEHGILSKVVYPTGGYSVFEYEPNITENQKVGGCRIKKISTYNQTGSITNIKRYFYNSRDQLSSSFGYTHFFPTYYSEYNINYDGMFYGSIVTCRYGCLNSSSLYSLYQNDQASIIYPYVTVSNGDNFEDGGEEHYFETPIEYPASVFNTVGGGIVLPLPYSNNAWYAGTKKKLYFFKKNALGQFEDVQIISYDYDRDDTRNRTEYLCVAMNYRVPSAGVFDNVPKINFYDGVKYTLYSVWQQLRSKTVVDVFGNYSIGKTTYYYYDNPTHAQLTREFIIDSKGDTIKKKYYYPQDYNSSLFSNLINNYIIGKPIDVRTYNNSQIVSCDQNKYNNYGQITDYYKGEIPNGTTDIPFNSGSAYTATHRATYTYDANKNLITIQPDKDAKTSLIWGYNNTLPIAKVVNANSDEIAYNGFEDNSTTGNWNFSSTFYAYVNGAAARGKKCISWNGGVVQGPLLEFMTNYKLRFYAKSNISNSVTVMGGNTISIPGDNQWHFYEATIQNIYTLTLGANGPLYLDEISLCPQNAMMTTYTYDPLIGMTSSTDENNVTTFYEYDSFGRLYRIKDNDGNILKQYEYHYKQ